MVDFVGSVDQPGLMYLPWDIPLERWPDEAIVALPRGISRHVVRFSRIGNRVFAIKEIDRGLAEHEYALLRMLGKRGIPAVAPVGVVLDRTDDRGEPLDACLITEHLSYSLPYRAVFSGMLRADTVNRLTDALALLIVRLHLIGFLWRDCSLSNTLFRRDAGAFAAYLVDAETGELMPSLSDGLRWYDLDTATQNLAGELLDLQAAGKLQQDIDPIELALELTGRYERLWRAISDSILIDRGDRRTLEAHIRRLNRLGFDVDEIRMIGSGEAGRARVHVKVVEADHHSRRLMRLTGLDVGENQARRLLNDLDTYRAARLRDYPEALNDEDVCAHRWVSERFQPVVEAVPRDLSGKLQPAEVYHEVLEHRWFLSERAGRDVGIEEAVQSYIREILAHRPDEQAVLGSRHGSDSDETTEIRMVLPTDTR